MKDETEEVGTSLSSMYLIQKSQCHVSVLSFKKSKIMKLLIIISSMCMKQAFSPVPPGLFSDNFLIMCLVFASNLVGYRFRKALGLRVSVHQWHLLNALIFEDREMRYLNCLRQEVSRVARAPHSVIVRWKG